MDKNTPVVTVVGACRRKVREAFTLVELLVVIGVIAILASLLLPALAGAKSRGQTVACLNNHRQLILAWLLYTDDYDGALANNFGDEDTKRTVADGTYLNWVNNVLNWEVDPDNTNAMLVTRGGLGPYCSGTISIYKCPADSVLSDLQRQAGYAARTRSISMNAMIGDAGEYTLGGTNVNNPGYRQYFRFSQLVAPSQLFVFIEEHPDTITDGYFLNRADTLKWIRMPASYHNGAANLAFADGHIETHRWLYAKTKPPPRPGALDPPWDPTIPAGEDDDFKWLMARTSYRSPSKN